MINKEKNVNLQITISKESLEKLNLIMAELSNGQIIALNKSQTIEFLINRFTLKNNELEREKTAIKKKSINQYSERLKRLSLKLNMSIPKLADYLKIPNNTLRKYFYGYHEPTDKNKIIIDKALKDNGI